MRHYTRPRPTLPDTTPFLADSKFAIDSPWHGQSVRKVVPTNSTNTTSSISELPVTVVSTDDIMIHTARSSQTTATGVVSVVSSLSSFCDPPKQRVQHRLKSKHKPTPPSLSTNNKYMPPVIAPTLSSVSSSLASQLPSVSYMNNGNGGLPMLSRIQPPNILSLSSPGGTKVTARMRLASLHSINESQPISSASVLEAEMDDFVDIEIERKETEIVAMKNKMKFVQDRSKVMDNHVLGVKEELAAVDAEGSYRSRQITKLSSVNATLINIIQSLELNTESDSGLTEAMIRLREDILPHVAHADRIRYAKLGVNDIHTINGRLKQLLVIMSREYFKSKKEVKVMFDTYESVRNDMKKIEAVNRTLQHDLDELLKDEAANTGKHVLEEQLAKGVGFNLMEGRDVNQEREDELNFESQLKSYCQRSAIDIDDSAIMLRRLFSHLARCPATLAIGDVASHVISHHLLQVLDMSVVSVYLMIPDRQGFMHRYTPRSPRPDLFDIANSESLVKEVLKLGMPVRINNLKDFRTHHKRPDGSFSGITDPIIDSVPGVVLQRIFSLPLKDDISQRFFGVMHFANKAGHGVFTASDEMLLKIFVHHFTWMLSACNVYTRTMSQVKWLQGLLRASTDLESTLVPPYVQPSNDPHHHRSQAAGTSQHDVAGGDGMTLARGRQARQPAEILQAWETVVRDAFKAFKVRAFLVTSPFIGMAPGSIVYLARNTGAGLTSHSSSLQLVTMPLTAKTGATSCGIAGRVASTGDWHCVDEGDPEPEEHNSDYDLRISGATMLTIPCTLSGAYADHQYPNLGIYGVLQIILSPQSPQLRPTVDDTDGISAHFAALWTLALLNPTLQTLLSYANNTPLPLTAPSLTENTQKRHIRPSLVQSPGYTSMSLRKIGGLDAIEEAAHLIVNEIGNGSPGVRRCKSLLKSEQGNSTVLVNTNLAAVLSLTPSRKRSFIEKTVDPNKTSKTNLVAMAEEGKEDNNETYNLAVHPSVADSLNSLGTSDSSMESSSPVQSRKKSFASHYPEGSPQESSSPMPSRKRSYASSHYLDGPGQGYRQGRQTSEELTVEELQDEIVMLNRQIGFITRDNERYHETEHVKNAKVFSASTLMEDLEGPTKKSIARGKSERFLKSLINDATKNLNELHGKVEVQLALLREMNEKNNDLLDKNEELTEWLEAVKDDEGVMQDRIAELEEESSLAAQHKTTDDEDEARLDRMRQEDLIAKEMALVSAREEYEGLCEAMAAVALTRAEVLEDDAKKSAARKTQRVLARQQVQQEQEGMHSTHLPFLEEEDEEKTSFPPPSPSRSPSRQLSRQVSKFEPIYEVAEEEDVQEEEDLEYLQTLSEFKSTRVEEWRNAVEEVKVQGLENLHVLRELQLQIYAVQANASLRDLAIERLRREVQELVQSNEELMKNEIDAVIEEFQNQAIAEHRRPPLPLSHNATSSSSKSSKISPKSSSSPPKTLSPSVSIASIMTRASVAEASLGSPLVSGHGLELGPGLFADDDDDSVPALSAFRGEATSLADSTPINTATTSPPVVNGDQPADFGGVGPNGEWLEFRDPSNGSVYYVNMISGKIRGIDPAAKADLESVVEGNEDSRVDSGISTRQVSGGTSPRGNDPHASGKKSLKDIKKQLEAKRLRRRSMD